VERADEVRKAALDLANKVREALGFEPVDHLYPGVQANAFACAITATVYNDTPEIKEKYIVATTERGVNVWEKPEGLYWSDVYGDDTPTPRMDRIPEDESDPWAERSWNPADLFHMTVNDKPAIVSEDMSEDTIIFIHAFDQSSDYNHPEVYELIDHMADLRGAEFGKVVGAEVKNITSK
jgi:hypothetical protein